MDAAVRACAREKSLKNFTSGSTRRPTPQLPRKIGLPWPQGPLTWRHHAAIKNSFGILQRVTFHQQIIARLMAISVKPGEPR
jgi:hypothetical protein